PQNDGAGTPDVQTGLQSQPIPPDHARAATARLHPPENASRAAAPELESPDEWESAKKMYGRSVGLGRFGISSKSAMSTVVSIMDRSQWDANTDNIVVSDPD